MDKKLTYDHNSMETESPFNKEITRIVIPHKFRQPQMEPHDGFGSPVDHVGTYKSRMALTTNLVELYCLAFPSTLKGLTNQWFHSLKLRSISSFN